MTPVPASKKVWIFDGSVEQYASVFTGSNNDILHVDRDLTCVACHGGMNSENSRALAHSTEDFAGIVTAEKCADCHAGWVDDTVGMSDDGLHTTLGGYYTILTDRGFNPAYADRFDEQCTKCHTAVGTEEDASTACGQCHVSVPATAGGGLISGHAFNEVPSMDNNCTACHGSRVKDEYYGQNNALLTRNKTAFDLDSPWKAADFQLAPDVHKAYGYACVDCHTTLEGGDYFGDEMHGVGHPDPFDGDRYNVATAPSCEDCHGPDQTSSFESVLLHDEAHLGAMECQVCHAQPYKNCFGCHTDVDVAGDSPTGLPFYTINEDDPNGENDALMTYRAGLNPRSGEEGRKQYAVLRHVPIDTDVFRYSEAGSVDGILTDVTALPTWKYATPHNIVRKTAITESCSNCHGSDYTKFWLTDPVFDAQGWVDPDGVYEQDEIDANTGVVTLDEPIPLGAP